MHLICKETRHRFKFKLIELSFDGAIHVDVFGRKNNRTVRETIARPRYSQLEVDVKQEYTEFLDVPLGTFLLSLKNRGDIFYQRFLNKYGDLKYAMFSISNQDYWEKTGVYAYTESENLRYIGRCRDSMKRRVNQGYGKINPKNCYLDGQATNCHINALVTESACQVQLWLCEISDSKTIERVERNLIRDYSPRWNILIGK